MFIFRLDFYVKLTFHELNIFVRFFFLFSFNYKI